MDAPITRTQLIDLLHTNKIVPELISTQQIQSLKTSLTILYPNDVQIELGEQVDRDRVEEIPTVLFSEADSKETYTLLMIDPDLIFPQSETYIAGQVNHWYLSHVKFDPVTLKFITPRDDKSQTDYLKPTPGPGPAHRYIFILAKEPKSYLASLTKVSQGNSDLKGRLEFNVSKFIEEEGLTIEAIAFMRVAANLKSTAENVGLVGESLGNKIVGE